MRVVSLRHRMRCGEIDDSDAVVFVYIVHGDSGFAMVVAFATDSCE